MASTRPAVLIVDDDEMTCDLIYEELAGEGYDCDIASDADDALAKLKKQIFHLALLDIKLPGMSGMELLKTVQKCCQTTAIIMITGVNDVHTAVEAMKLGASDYVVKPFTPDKLIASISTVLKNWKPNYTAYNTIPGKGSSNHGQNAKRSSFSGMNAIAYGIDAQVDGFDFHSRIVTDKTVELARSLGLPRREIKKWAVARDKLYSGRDRRIESMLSKLERSPMAQVMLGLTRSVCQFPESNHRQN